MSARPAGLPEVRPTGLDVRGLGVDLDGEPILRQVACAVGRGEILAVTGPSGSGKSTLLAAIAGLLRLTSGTIAFDGEDLTDVPAYRRGFGLMLQESLLFPHLTVAGNIGYGPACAGWPREQIRSRVAELLAWIDLPDYGRRRVTALSGGQAQRIALARAIAPRPRLLLLDEPFSALDPARRRRLAGEVRTMLRHERVAAIHVTHDLAEADALADRVLALADLQPG